MLLHYIEKITKKTKKRLQKIKSDSHQIPFLIHGSIIKKLQTKWRHQWQTDQNLWKKSN